MFTRWTLCTSIGIRITRREDTQNSGTFIISLSHSNLFSFNHFFYLFIGWESTISGSFNQIQGERCWKVEWRKWKLLEVCIKCWMDLVMLNSGVWLDAFRRSNDSYLISIDTTTLHALNVRLLSFLLSMTSASMLINVFRTSSNPLDQNYIIHHLLQSIAMFGKKNYNWHSHDLHKSLQQMNDSFVCLFRLPKMVKWIPLRKCASSRMLSCTYASWSKNNSMLNINEKTTHFAEGQQLPKANRNQLQHPSKYYDRANVAFDLRFTNEIDIQHKIFRWSKII